MSIASVNVALYKKVELTRCENCAKINYSKRGLRYLFIVCGGGFKNKYKVALIGMITFPQNSISSVSNMLRPFEYEFTVFFLFTVLYLSHNLL